MYWNVEYYGIWPVNSATLCGSWLACLLFCDFFPPSNSGWIIRKTYIWRSLTVTVLLFKKKRRKVNALINNGVRCSWISPRAKEKWNNWNLPILIWICILEKKRWELDNLSLLFTCNKQNGQFAIISMWAIERPVHDLDIWTCMLTSIVSIALITLPVQMVRDNSFLINCRLHA